MKLEKMTPLPNPIIPSQPELRLPTHWRVHIELVWRDVWIGFFFTSWHLRTRYRTDRRPYYGGGCIRVDEQRSYVCIVPCLPIVITRTRETEVPYYSK